MAVVLTVAAGLQTIPPVSLQPSEAFVSIYLLSIYSNVFRPLLSGDPFMGKQFRCPRLSTETIAQ
jgi:hypothetical protein